MPKYLSQEQVDAMLALVDVESFIDADCRDKELYFEVNHSRYPASIAINMRHKWIRRSYKICMDADFFSERLPPPYITDFNFIYYTICPK